MTEIEAIDNLNKLVEIWEDDENMYSDIMNIEIDQEFMDCIYRSIDALKEVQKYHGIGTVEEFRDAMEKQKPKEPTFEINLSDYASRFVCDCGKVMIVNHDCGVMDNHDAPNYCPNCGVKFDWNWSDSD